MNSLNCQNDAKTIEELAEKCLEELDTPPSGDSSCEASEDGLEREYLNKFYTISLLCIDVYMKKQLIESLIDSIPQSEPDKTDRKKTS